jgi:DNA-3-methyladenine glycosylase I
MELTRCEWCNGHQIYKDYHDKEWGVPVFDDRKQFEFLTLESAQAGLSWLTVLKKRENYRKAFADFDPEKVAQYGNDMVEELLQNPGIIRNRLKITSAINNAARFLEVVEEFGSFSKYIWGFVDGKPVINHWRSLSEVPAKTPLSDAISKDLLKRGFRFVGSTIIYAHLQATGLVMDHVTYCHRYGDLSGNDVSLG